MDRGDPPLEQFAPDSGGAKLSQRTGVLEFATPREHQFLQGSVGPSDGPRDGRAVCPVHSIEALVAGVLHPQLDRGHAHPEAVRHRAQGCPTPYGSHHGLSFLG